VERYEYRETSIMGGEPEPDVWIGREGTIPPRRESDCESTSQVKSSNLKFMYLQSTASRIQTAENIQGQGEQIAEQRRHAAIIEYKK
jgi:hypothetical protein